MPRHTDKDSERVAGDVPSGSPAFWPQEDFPQGILDGDLVRYNAATELWERQSSLDFIAEFTDAFGGGGGSYDQDLNTDDSPAFVTVKLSGLTDGRIPYHVNDTTGLADGPLKTDVDDAVSKRHAQGTDTALGVLGTKNPPIDADKALYRNSEASDALVTSTWAQIKAYLKTYFDTLYNLYVHPNHSGDVTSVADGATTIANKQTLTGSAPVSISNAPTVIAGSAPAVGLVNNAVSPAAVTAIDIDGTLAGNADTKIPTQKAVKTYADTKTTLAAVKADADISSAISLKHAAVTIDGTSPLSLSTQAISLKNNAGSPAAITAIDVGALANSDTVIPTSKAVTTKCALYLPLSGGTMTGNIVMPDGGTIGQAAGPLLTFDDTNNYLEIAGCNVGIGTTTPLDLLTVSLAGTPTAGLWNTNFTGGNEAILRFRHGDGTADGSGDGSVAEIRSYLPGAWDCDLRFYTTNNKTLNTTPTLALTGNGDVGIATATPFDKLSVYAAAAGDYKGISIKAGDTTANSKIRVQFLANNGVQLSSIEQPSSSAYVLSIINNQNQGIKIQAGASSDANNIIAFLTSGANERMRLTNDGYLGIGMTAVNAALQVNLGLGIGYGSGISATHGARRSLQICTDTNYGGAYDNHSGFLLCSTMDTGWGYAQLHFCHSDGWGSYDTANPVMTLAGTGIKLNDHLLIQPILKDYGEAVNAMGNLTGAKTVDITLGNVVTGTATGDTTWTFSNPTATGNACSFTLILTNGGSKTQTWPASVDWPGGTAPTLTASGVDVLTFITIDAGTTWRGFLTGKDLK